MSLRNQSIVALAAFVILVGCSGGDDGGGDSGYSGNTSAATVDDSNKDTVRAAAVIGSNKAIETSAGASAISPSSASRDAINDLVGRVALERSSLSERASGSADLDSTYCNGGGSGSYSFDLDNNGYGSFEYTYNNCTLSYGSFTFTYDGYMYYERKTDDSFYFDYDLTYTYGSESYTINATAVCDSTSNCTYEDNFTIGGTSYRVSNASVSGNSSTGYDLEVRVYHEDLGYVEIEGSNLVTCSSGGFSSGTISVTDSTNAVVMTIVFDSCTTASVEFDGVTTSVSY